MALYCSRCDGRLEENRWDRQAYCRACQAAYMRAWRSGIKAAALASCGRCGRRDEVLDRLCRECRVEDDLARRRADELTSFNHLRALTDRMMAARAGDRR